MRVKILKWSSILLLIVLVACGPKVNEEKIDEATLQGNGSFAFDLFRELKQEDQNVFISPYSISLVMSMTLAGAEGETESEIRRALYYEGMDDSTIIDTHQNYSAYLSKDDQEVSIDLANSMWLDEEFQVKDEFESLMTDNLRAQLFQQKLSDPSIVEDMNGWVKGHTGGMIDQLIKEPYSKNTRLLLTNAIYFNGTWQYPFSENSTKEGTFHLVSGEEQQLDLMHQQESFSYMETKDMKGVRLPYGEEGEEGNYSMYVMLPIDQSLDTLIQKFDAEAFAEMKGQMIREPVTLTLPSFKLQYGVKSLNDSLKSLGMEDVFSETEADLSDMSDVHLFLSALNHKAVIDVTEKGTEAAAVTQAEFEKVSGFAEQPKEFRADRPFFYIIADEKYDSILFMGTYEGEL
ncbi:serpin family protein [Halobacillus locisalis]|uniref:Serpin family protein n=1 Tax=Halobacillus locisalis TaxID=220753 RepID=A0A838CW41_9BACI|nr:serpin family protein [Halobacillus locisalis]MBA2176267.1 serpin family protein [Halobacillus locisalis]